MRGVRKIRPNAKYDPKSQNPQAHWSGKLTRRFDIFHLQRGNYLRASSGKQSSVSHKLCFTRLLIGGETRDSPGSRASAEFFRHSCVHEVGCGRARRRHTAVSGLGLHRPTRARQETALGPVISEHRTRARGRIPKHSTVFGLLQEASRVNFTARDFHPESASPPVSEGA